MKYTDGKNIIEAAQFQGDRDDTLNLQRIGFYPVIVDIRDVFNPKLRIGKGLYINKGDFVVKIGEKKYIGCERSEFIKRYKPFEEEKNSRTP